MFTDFDVGVSGRAFMSSNVLFIRLRKEGVSNHLDKLCCFCFHCI